MTRDLKLMMASMFLWGCGYGLWFILYPLYLAKLGANGVAIGSIMSLAAVVPAVSHIPASWLADRWGRKELLAAGWFLGCLAALIMFAAPNLTWFTVGLVAYNFTYFMMSPMEAYLTEARGTLSVPRVLTLNTASYWAGMILSPTLGGQAAQLWGLRSVFGLAFIFFVLSTGILLALRRQPTSAPPRGVNRYRVLLTDAPFVGLMLLSFAALAAFQVGLPLVQNFLADVRGFDPGLVGLLGSFNALGMTVLNVAGGRLTPRRGYLLAQALMALSLVLLLTMGAPVWVALAYFCQGGWGLSKVMTVAQVGQVVDKPKLVLAYGITETVVWLATSFGALVAGMLYSRAHALPFQVSLALLAVTALLMWRLAPHSALQPETDIQIKKGGTR